MVLFHHCFTYHWIGRMGRWDHLTIWSMAAIGPRRSHWWANLYCPTWRKVCIQLTRAHRPMSFWMWWALTCQRMSMLWRGCRLCYYGLQTIQDLMKVMSAHDFQIMMAPITMDMSSRWLHCASNVLHEKDHANKWSCTNWYLCCGYLTVNALSCLFSKLNVQPQLSSDFLAQHGEEIWYNILLLKTIKFNILQFFWHLHHME